MKLYVKNIIINLAWAIIFLGTEFLFHCVLLYLQTDQKNAFIYNALSNYDVISAVLMIIFFLYPIISVLVVEKIILKTSIHEKGIVEALLCIFCVILFLLEKNNNIIFSLCEDYATEHGDFTTCGIVYIVLLLRHIFFGIAMFFKFIGNFLKSIRIKVNTSSKQTEHRPKPLKK